MFTAETQRTQRNFIKEKYRFRISDFGFRSLSLFIIRNSVFRNLIKKPLVLVLFLFLFLFPGSEGQAQNIHPEKFHQLQSLIGNQDSVLIADPQGKIIFSKNAEKKFIPASTLKILTSLVAFHYLGSDFKFATEFYLDKNENLKIKGYGDPLLTSEVLPEIATAIRSTAIRLRIKNFNDLVLDGSYFNSILIPGVTSSFEPYDSPNGALCVNFNTVYFKRINSTYVSAEPQTPLLPFVLKRIEKSSLNRGRIILSGENDENILYAGHLLSYFLKKKGIKSKGNIRAGQVYKEKDLLIFKYISCFSMDQIIMKLLDHSNNFIANQLLIAAGAKAFGPPGTLEKGVRAALTYAKNILKEDICFVEGSGISRQNRLSAKQLHKILEEFKPHRNLMPYMNRIFYKTGTLNGIRTRAGYLDNGDRASYCFVILLNTPGKTTKPIMDRLLTLIPDP